MKRKRFLIVLFLFFRSFVYLSAQENEMTDPKYIVDLKLYSNFLAFNSNYTPSFYEFEYSPFQFWGISPAVSIRKSGKTLTHEFEPKLWARKRDGGDIREYEVGLRYELCWYLKNDKNPGVRFGWGISNRMYYYRANAKNLTFGLAPGNSLIVQSGGYEFAATMHFDINVSKKMKIVFSFTSLNYSFEIEYVNYISPGTGFTNTSSRALVFDQRLLRLGLGYQL